MRLPNDRILAEKCQGEVNLILGRHDHNSVFEKIDLVSIDVCETEKKLSRKWGSWLQKGMFAILRAPYFQIFFPS
jgi:hypothetical protein